MASTKATGKGAAALEAARLGLEAVEKLAALRADWLRAVGQYHAAMAEGLSKRAEAATQAEEARRLRTARNEYVRALQEAKGRLREAERDARRVGAAGRNAARLAWGELLDPDLVAPAWGGFRLLVGRARGALRAELLALPVRARHRRGRYFCRNRYPNSPCADAPAAIRRAVTLFDWARKKSYTARLGSPPHALLIEMLERIERAAQEQAEEMAERVAEARRDLLALRQTRWDSLQPAQFPPKTSKSR